MIKTDKKENVKRRKYKDLTLTEQYEFTKKLYLSRGIKWQNLTRKYHLGDGLKDKGFNLRWNQKFVKNQDLLKRFKYDITREFTDALKYRIQNKDHIILVFYGATGTGKSWAAIRLAEIIKNLFMKYLENKSKILLSFSDDEYAKKLSEMNSKDIMIRDETPNMSGEGSRTLQQNVKNVMNITREGQFCFLFVSPDLAVKPTNSVSFYLESAGISKENGKSRFLIYDETMLLLGRIHVNKPKNKEFLVEYGKRKTDNINQLVAGAGDSGVTPDMIKRDKKTIKFLEFCREYGAKYKGEFKALVYPFNLKNPEFKIRNLEKEDIINYTSLMMRGISTNKTIKKKEKEKILSKIYTDSKDFKFDLKDLYDRVKKGKKGSKWRNTERDLEVYDLYINTEITQLELAERYQDLSSAQAVNAIIDKVKGEVYRIRGKMFEEQYYNFLRDKYINNIDIFIKYDGAKEKPDIIIGNKKLDELVVLSLKCLDLPKKERKYPYYVRWREKKHIGGFMPEIEYAGKNVVNYKTVNVFVVICNANNGNVKSFPFNIQRKKEIKIEEEF